MPTVLVTRAASDSGPLCVALAEAGFVPIRVPLVERVQHVERVRGAGGRRHDGWVLTSAAAVDVLHTAGLRPSGWVAAVGPATARRATELGWRVDHVPETATAADLVRTLGDLSGQRVLYPRADLAGTEARRGLEAAGATVDDVVAYANRLPSGAQTSLRAAWPPDVITLLSGSAARRLAALRPPGQVPPLVVIGPSTAAAAAEVGLPVARVADPHTVAGVVAAVAALFSRPGDLPR